MTAVSDMLMAELARELGSEAHLRREQNGALRLLPQTTEQVAAVLRIASHEGLSVAPTGGGTKLAWGNPISPEILLDVRGLRGIREHVWQDLTATVGAGTAWQEMQAALAQHGQRVALDPLLPNASTVGGVLASNDSGSLRLRYGSLRDLVLGVTVVLSDGTVARSGGKVVKNVAGYDLPKLLVGSFGTLGVITEATFRLHPLPSATRTYTLRSLDVKQLENVMKAALAAQFAIDRMQLRNESTAFALDVELASAPEVVAEHHQRLEHLAQDAVLEPATGAVWTERERILATPGATVLKVMALPTKLAALIAGFAQLSQMPDHGFQAVAEPAGIVTVACSGPTESIQNVLAELRDRLRSSSGHVVVQQRGALPAGSDVWGGTPAAIEVMRAIKSEFDPTRTLNPGKFVGGV